MEFRQGEIIWDSVFVYPSASLPCDKFLVVLNSAHDGFDDVIVAPFTSNVPIPEPADGCNSDNAVFFFRECTGSLSQPSVLQFRCIANIDMDELRTRFSHGSIRRKNEYLHEDQLIEVLDCLSCVLDDVPEDFIPLIFP